MTIVDFAKETGLSKQAIYQKLKRKNIKLSDIQQPDNNELTQEGLFTLAELFKIKVEDNGKPIPASKEGVNVDSKKVNDNSAEWIIKRLEEENEQLFPDATLGQVILFLFHVQTSVRKNPRRPPQAF